MIKTKNLECGFEIREVNIGMRNNTLIAVYKDELIVNELRKLVENNNRMKRSQGGNISITTQTEKAWLQDKYEDTNSKVLFIGDIAGTENLIPVLDVKFNNYGVKYGWAGNRAVLVADAKELKSPKNYMKFCDELQKEISYEEYRKNVPLERFKSMEKPINTLEILVPFVWPLKGVQNILKDIEKVKRQQYLYGLNIFYKRDFENFMEI